MAYHPFRNPGLKIVSVILAALLWMTVSRDQSVERSVRVPLEFQNVPEGIEIVGALASAAGERLQATGYGNVTVRHGDGYQGWPEHAPYDGIIVTAAAPHIPPPLVEQLKPGARLVIPVGLPGDVQQLMLVEKSADGTVSSRCILLVAFVPLTRSKL